MAKSLHQLLREKQEETERWMRQREAQLRRSASELEARGRQAYSDAIRTGEKVVARTSQEVRELGRAAAQKAEPVKAAVRPPSSKVPTRPPSPRAPSARERPATAIPMEHLRAGVSGAVDEAGFGLADRVLAAGGALREGGLNNFVHHYDENMTEKRAADAHDATHFATARNVGRAAGFVGSVAAMGVPAVGRAVVSMAPRAVQAAAKVAGSGSLHGLDPRGLTRLAAAGGGTAGVIDHAIVDALTGRPSSPLEYAKAAASGAAGGLVTRYAGPTIGGAVGGAVTSAIDDVSHLRAPSASGMIGAAHAGAVIGRLGGVGGTYRTAMLSARGKGQVGELFSRAKAVARGDEIIGAGRRVNLDKGGWTFADALSRNRRTGRVSVGESKMGPTAELSPRQIQAKNQFGDDYVIDGWRFKDVGKASGAAVSPLGAMFTDDDPPPRR